jgi:hypothetical protein
MEIMNITMFWNKLNFDDQNRTSSSMKIAQQITVKSVATIGANGLSFVVIITDFIVLVIYLFPCMQLNSVGVKFYPTNLFQC